MKLIKFLYLFALIFTLTSAGTNPDEVISCGPGTKYKFRANIVSLTSGNWSSPFTWVGGAVPQPTDAVSIAQGHTVTLDVNATVAGITCPGSLIFSPEKSVTLQSSKNIIITGTLHMRPSSPSVVQLIRFININEDKFIGGGEDPMDSDIGLWVMGSGKLDLVGSPKTGWTNAMNGITAGSSSMTLRGPPENWAVGDELMITPTAAGATNFDIVTVRSVSGSTISTSTVTGAHPIINNKWTSEVCNLTRNIRIEGTPTGKSHVFIRSVAPQNIQYVQFRYLGPRKDQAVPNDPKGRDGIKEFILGRYGIHFHHCMEGSRGSIVESCVMRDVDNHAYVTHGSHGITVHGNIAYNVTETPYWWDEGPQHASNDIKWVRDVAALVKFVNRSVNIENADSDPTMASKGFLLGHGDGNVCDSNVAVGTMGDARLGGGFRWEAVNNSYLEGVWRFVANIAHNCTAGFETWQNVQMLHVNEDCVAYNNGIGIFHGAYLNVYKYKRFELYNNPLILHAASSNSARLRIEDFVIDAAGQDYAVIIEGNSEPGDPPILIRNLQAKNYKIAAVYDQSSETVHSADIIQTDGKFVMNPLANAKEVMRVQPTSGQARYITRNKDSAIKNFAPTLWGTGTGLLGEYFNNPDFSSPAISRIDNYIGFSEWKGTQSQIHYSIKYSTYSVRWTGKIQPQFTEIYRITAQTENGGAKLFIDGKLITGPVPLVAGKLYDIRIEYSKANSIKSGVGLLWTSPSLELFTKGSEYVPQSQLYPPDSSPPPVNRPPVVSAGQDITIQLPINTVSLKAVANDPDNNLATGNWTKITGPSNPPFSLSPVNPGFIQYFDLIEGTYIFRYVATDDKGAVGFDDVVVTVKPAPVNQPPTLTVSASVQVTRTGVITLISDAKDPEGGTLTYKWRFIDGPATAVITSPTSAVTTTNTLPAGTYTFELEVSDNSGNKVVKTVSATI